MASFVKDYHFMLYPHAGTDHVNTELAKKSFWMHRGFNGYFVVKTDLEEAENVP